MGGYKIRDQTASYFVTLTTVGWVDVFTRKRYRDMLIDSLKFCQENKGLIVYGFVIMSNHIHLIIQAKQGFRLSSILRDFKKYTSAMIIKSIQNDSESRRDWMLIVFSYHARFNSNNSKYQMWQQHNRPKETYSLSFILQKLIYIHRNPVVAGWVKKAEDYVYSSASNYDTGTGILDVTILRE